MIIESEKGHGPFPENISLGYPFFGFEMFRQGIDNENLPSFFGEENSQSQKREPCADDCEVLALGHFFG